MKPDSQILWCPGCRYILVNLGNHLRCRNCGWTDSCCEGDKIWEPEPPKEKEPC